MILVGEARLANMAKTWHDDWKPNAMALWNAKLCRVQFRDEFIKNVFLLAMELHWMPPLPDHVHAAQSDSVEPFPVQEDIECNEDEDPPHRDPTMPQFRPNSIADIQQMDEQRVLHEEHSQTGSSDTEPYPWSDFSNSDTRLADQMMYDDGDDPLTADNFIFVNFRMPTSSAEPASASQPHPVRMSSDSDGGDGALPPPGSAPINDGSLGRDDESAPSVILDPVLESALPLPVAPQPRRPIVEHTDDPVFFVIYHEADDPTLHIEVQPIPNWTEDVLKLHVQRIRRDAFSNPKSALRIPFLASLEIVEAEISERKGSGLISYDEFTEKMAEGKLRFMESWIDWVSY
jgi:hypothetical protein